MSRRWEGWKQWLMPSPSLSLEQQFFQSLCLLGGVLALFVVIPMNSFQNLSPWVDRGVFVFGLASLAIWWASRRGHYLRKTMILSLVACLDLIWFPNGGSQGSIGFYYFTAALLVVLFVERRFRILGLALLVTNILSLHLAEYLWPQLTLPFHDPRARLLDLSTGYLLSLACCALMLWVIQTGFNRERKRLQVALQELKASEARHRLLADNATDVIWTMDLEARFTYVSPSVQRLRGYTSAEVMEQTLEELLTPASSRFARERLHKALDAVSKGAPFPGFRGELEQVCKDGSTVWTETTVSDIRNEDGQFMGLLGVTRDLTERKRSEEERGRLQAQLHQTQKLESLGSLAGGMAHDMNNVLGAILGLASAHLEIQPVESPAHRAFDTIYKAALRGGKLVKGMLGFARQSPAEERELDVNAILREEVGLLERTTLSKVRLEVALEPGLRAIRGDAGALANAFMNLCVNAVDAMPDQGRLTLRTRNVGQKWIEVVVEDTGTGMSKEVLEKALDPFFTTKEVGKGTGLGLPLVYSTVKAHQGQMELRSELGRGTRVIMRFPCHEPLAGAPESAAQAYLGPSSGKLKILVVDDDDLIQSSLQGLLGLLGHESLAALSGEQALAELEAGYEPDLVILDVNMPGLSGAGTLPRIRAFRLGLPVLLSTGRVDQAALNLVESYPLVTLMPKPYGLLELRKHLEPYVGD